MLQQYPKIRPENELLEAQVRANLQLAGVGYRVGDHAEVAVALHGAVGVQRGSCEVGRAVIRGLERGRVGQIECFADNLKLDSVFLETEGAGNTLIHVEQSGTAQEISTGGSQSADSRIGEGGDIEVGAIGIVAAQNLYNRVDLVCR